MFCVICVTCDSHCFVFENFSAYVLHVGAIVCQNSSLSSNVCLLLFPVSIKVSFEISFN